MSVERYIEKAADAVFFLMAAAIITIIGCVAIVALDMVI